MKYISVFWPQLQCWGRYCITKGVTKRCIEIPVKVYKSELFSFVQERGKFDLCAAVCQLNLSFFGGEVVIVHKQLNFIVASNELAMVWTFLCRSAKERKESLLGSVGFSSKMRLITAKTIGECSCFKNKCCEHDCLQNRSDTNLFRFWNGIIKFCLVWVL